MSDADILATIPLFSKLSKRDRSRLHKAAHELSYEAGTELAVHGEVGRFFFVILDGQAVVEIQGREVRTLSTGDYFGEMALIDRSLRAATVRAVTPLRCLTLTQTVFRPLATENPDVAWALLEAMVEKVREADARIDAGSDAT
jgi:CRP-like cAMP-binding protein